MEIDEHYDRKWAREVLGGNNLLGQGFSINLENRLLEFQAGDIDRDIPLAIRTRKDFRELCRLLGKKLREDRED